MAVFVTLGIILTLILQSFVPAWEQINSLVNSLNQMQIPTASAIITYLGILGLVGFIGYSVVQANVG